MIESDLSEILSDVIRKALCETIENQLNTNNYHLNISSASKSGQNNFVGVVYRVSFRKDDGNDEYDENSTLILKVAPKNLARRSQFMCRMCFLREMHIYNKVLPNFRMFEETKGIYLEENGFNEYPKCYRTVDKEPNESILLEDMSIRGFQIIDRHKEEITADHVNLVLQILGKFHAISFALKDQQSEMFNELISELSENYIRRDEQLLREYLLKESKRVLNVLSAGEDANLMAKVKKLFEKHPMDIAADCLDVKLTGAATVISHGDTWQNNTMFKYDKNGKPIKICLLDWQISRHSSPIIDIVHFIFCCTTKELRDAHYDEFLKVYHESLSAHIQRLGSNPEKLFPYKLMLEHFDRFAKFGLILAMMLIPMLTYKGIGVNLDESAENFQKGDQFDENIFITEHSIGEYHKRIHDVVVDMVRLGYI